MENINFDRSGNATPCISVGHKLVRKCASTGDDIAVALFHSYYPLARKLLG
jgi:hypothetical protein